MALAHHRNNGKRRNQNGQQVFFCSCLLCSSLFQQQNNDQRQQHLYYVLQRTHHKRSNARSNNNMRAFVWRALAIVSAVLTIVGAAASTTTMIRGAAAVPLPLSPAASSACDRIHPENLPDECECRDGNGPHSLVVECLKHFNGTFFNDTIGIKLVVEPCNENGSSVSLDITDVNHNIDFPIERITAGEQKIIPLPGLSVVVPQLGHLGIDAVVAIAGNPDRLFLKVGLDACLVVRERFICAESLPYLDTAFPWWIMNGTYHFGDFCNSTNITTTGAAISL